MIRVRFHDVKAYDSNGRRIIGLRQEIYGIYEGSAWICGIKRWTRGSQSPTQEGNWRIRCCGVLLSFFCLDFHRLFLLMTSLLLFVLILRSTYLAGLIFLAMPSKFQLDEKFFLSLVYCL